MADAVRFVFVFRKIPHPQKLVQGPVFHYVVETFMDDIPQAPGAEVGSPMEWSSPTLLGAFGVVAGSTSITQDHVFLAIAFPTENTGAGVGTLPRGLASGGYHGNLEIPAFGDDFPQMGDDFSHSLVSHGYIRFSSQLL